MIPYNNKATTSVMTIMMKKLLMPLSSFRTLVLLVSVTRIWSYDVGCLYPKEMPVPLQAMEILPQVVSLRGAIETGVETPIVVYGALLSTMCEVNCLAYHDADVLNVLTLERPLVSAPSAYGHNAWSIMLCVTQCFYSIFTSEDSNNMADLLEEWNLQLERFRPDLVEAALGQDALAILGILQETDFHPFMLGQLVALEIGAYAQTTGWNQDGTLVWDPLTQSPVPCTSNCMPYADTSGYTPRNTPGRPYAADEKYNVTGADMFWQPLLEDDGNGYFSRQEHVTPHAGASVRPYADENLRNRSVDAPAYDYRTEALQVVEELRLTASSLERKAQIVFYDDKLRVRFMYEYFIRSQFQSQHSFQFQNLISHGGSAAEYDAVVAVWTEKRRHDLVRPTTVIQRWANDELFTYNGDQSSTEAQTIAARDFQAFIRVMPHSEFPSGSACICTAYQEFADAFTKTFYDDVLRDMKVGPDGFNWNCKGEQSLNGPRISCEQDESFTIPDMMALKEQCGESRLWGGMHFSKSVPAAYELCSGLADVSMERIMKIWNNSTFGGNAYFEGDPRPVCLNDNNAASTDTDNSETISPTSLSETEAPASSVMTKMGSPTGFLASLLIGMMLR